MREDQLTSGDTARKPGQGWKPGCRLAGRFRYSTEWAPQEGQGSTLLDEVQKSQNEVLRKESAVAGPVMSQCKEGGAVS